MKIKVFTIMTFCLVAALFICLLVQVNSGSNSKLARDEIKAYFKPAEKLNYCPDMDKVSSVIIGGAISMPIFDASESDGTVVYNKKKHIEQITDFLNNLPLVWASQDELPNMSPDSFIQYLDDEDNILQNFTIYGQVFIYDVNNKKLYRIKNINKGIGDRLENMKIE